MVLVVSGKPERRAISLPFGKQDFEDKRQGVLHDKQANKGFRLGGWPSDDLRPNVRDHGGSDYDVQHPKTLKGTVTEFYWSNPHCQVFLDVKDDSGKAVNWTIETLAPAVLKRAAGPAKHCIPATRSRSPSFPAEGTPVGMLRKVVLPDGTELNGGALGEQPPQ